jgi:hypothetical protein
MKRVKFLLLAMASLLMFSCNEKADILQPVSSDIDGPLSDYFVVVVKDYKPVGNRVNIEFQRVKEGMFNPQITAEFLDAKGHVIGTSVMDLESDEAEMRFLLANKVGESSTLGFKFDEGKPVQVRFSSRLIEKRPGDDE